MIKSQKSVQSVTRMLATAGISAAMCAGISLVFLAQPRSSAAADLPVDGAMPTSQPADQAPVQRPVEEVIADFQAVNKELAGVLPQQSLTDDAARKNAAPKAIPILYHRDQLLDELQASKKVSSPMMAALKQSNQSLLYLLGDAPTVTKVNDMAASADLNRQIQGKSIVFSSRWSAAGSDPTATKSIIDEVEKLDRAHPENSKLTMLTMGLAQSATGPNKDRLMSLVTDVMTDPYAKRLKVQIAEQKANDAKQQAMLNKPFVIAAKTVDGKDFTTADWKGKVVMVDFWATWCGPCKAGLPHVKDIYNQYHAKGLEIVGVSNDYDAQQLQDFTPQNNMPWPQLFDADAAANHQWNSVSAANGVQAIPAMFLIDKKGVLRSITAREEMDDLIPKLLAE